jgi:hypothetical protein
LGLQGTGPIGNNDSENLYANRGWNLAQKGKKFLLQMSKYFGNITLFEIFHIALLNNLSGLAEKCKNQCYQRPKPGTMMLLRLWKKKLMQLHGSYYRDYQYVGKVQIKHLLKHFYLLGHVKKNYKLFDKEPFFKLANEPKPDPHCGTVQAF